MATKIDTTDYVPYRLFAGDASYLYGVKNGQASSKLFRLPSVTGDGVEVYNFGLTYNTINAVWTAGGGLVFALVQNAATSKYYLYKSADYGDNFGDNAPAFDNGNYVLILGDTDGTEGNQIPSVYALGRGFAELNGDLYIGEYNVNGSRVAGGANDQVRLLKSADSGTTWEAAATWNTDGVNTNVRHIHSVHADNGYIYVAFGDTDPQSGILRWNPAEELTGNQNLDQYANCQSGAQRYRTGDILFPAGDYLYYMADTDSPDAERGIWKMLKDLSAVATRVNSDITAFAAHSGWYGLVLPDGNMVFTEFLESGATDTQVNFYSTSDGGATWEIVAKYGWKATTGGALSLFSWNGEILYSGRACGKGDEISTISLTASGTYAEEFPVIVHPVYWVSTTGTDGASPNGYSPRSPWKTLKYALNADRITNGGRVILAAGEYTENAILMDYDANAYPGYSEALTVIEGQGRTRTKVTHNALDSGTYLFYIQKEETPILFKNLWAVDAKAGVSENIFYTVAHATSQKGVVYLRDCRIGDPEIAFNVCVRNGQAVDIDRCILDAGTGSGHVVTVANTTLNIKRSILKGSNRSVYIDGAGATVEILATTLHNYSQTGVQTPVGSTLVPTVKNCIFSPGGGAVADILDSAGLTETDAEIDYNIYGGTVSGLANGGGTHSITGAPLFRNAAAENYRLRSSSPCINAGTDVGLTTDYAGRAIRGVPDIGAYEFYPEQKGGFRFGRFRLGL